jgi:effector-binding domain-containing protein
VVSAALWDTRTGQVQACVLEVTPTVVTRAAMAPDRVAGWLSRVYRSIGERLDRDGVAVVGPPFACYTADGGRVEIEAGYPVSVPVAGDGVVMPSGLPGGPAAVTVHEGPLDSLDVAYRRVESWLAAQGFTPRGRHWERYLVGEVTHEGDPARWRTEVVVPYGWEHWIPIVHHREAPSPS